MPSKKSRQVEQPREEPLHEEVPPEGLPEPYQHPDQVRQQVVQRVVEEEGYPPVQTVPGEPVPEKWVVDLEPEKQEDDEG